VSGRRPAVCIVRHDAYPEDSHVRRDAEALVEAGYDVTVVALSRVGQAARDCVNGVDVYRLPVRHQRGGVLRYMWEYAAFFVLALLMLAVLHARKRFQVIEVDNMPDLLVFCALVPRLAGARVVLFIFDNMPELLVVARGYSPRHPLVGMLRLMERASARFADRVIVTQEMARRVVTGRGVPADKVATVMNCPDEALFAPVAPRTPPGDAAFVIVTHGLILERFGIQVLLDALPRVAEVIPHVCLQVIGRGEYRSELERRARKNGVADRVEFRDWVPVEELPELIARANVGYVGMLCDLMLSNKLMEYVALNVPAVVSRWPTYQHYFPDDAVTYFRPGDAADLAAAIVSVWREPETAARRAACAAGLYQRYRWKVQRQTYLDVYTGLLRGTNEHEVARTAASLS
jgi:glycosyltransferase involved in cell wall biosynthesis